MCGMHFKHEFAKKMYGGTNWYFVRLDIFIVDDINKLLKVTTVRIFYTFFANCYINVHGILLFFS